MKIYVQCFIIFLAISGAAACKLKRAGTGKSPESQQPDKQDEPLPLNNSEPQNTPAPTPEPQTRPVEATLESVQGALVNQACLSCHTKATRENRFVDLTDLSKIMLDHGSGNNHDHLEQAAKSFGLDVLAKVCS